MAAPKPEDEVTRSHEPAGRSHDTAGFADLLRPAFEHLPVAVLLVASDGAITLANREAERIFLYPGAELIGLSVDALVPDSFRGGHADLRREFLTDPSPSRMAHGRELLGRRKDGSELPVEVWLTPISVRGALFVVASVVDITERRRDQSATAEAEDAHRQFEALIGQLGAEFITQPPEDVGPAIADALGRVVRALELDRASCFQLVEETGEFVHTHQWTRPGCIPPPPRISAGEQFPWHLAHVRAGELIAFSTIEDVPDQIDRENLRRFGTQSGMTIPVMVRGRPWGAVSFSAVRTPRDWTPALINRLRLVAAMFAGALGRQEAEREFRQALSEIGAHRDQLRDENAQLRLELDALRGEPAPSRRSVAPLHNSYPPARSGSHGADPRPAPAQAQQALQDPTYESLADRIAVIDRDGTILAVNRAWDESAKRDTLNFSAAAGTGTGVNYFEVCRRSAAQGCLDARQALEGLGSVCIGAAQSYDLAYECAAPGEVRWWLMRAMPLRRPEGGAIVSHLEITGATTVALAHVIGEEQFRGLTDTLLVPIFTVDLTGRLLFGNASWAEATGDSVSIGTPWTSACHPADRDRAEAAMHAAAAAISGFEVEVRLLQGDGTYRWWAVSAGPHFGPRGDILTYVATCRDITPARHAQQSLHEAGARLIASQEAVRSRIARELHDDLGQQVVMLVTRLDMLMNQEKIPQKELRAAVAQTRQGLQELAQAIHNLSHELHPAKLRLLGLERTIAGLARDLGHDSAVRVTFTSDGVIGDVSDERALCIFRIAQEALQNAVKHSRATVVEVTLTGTLTEINLHISDNGIGFDSLSMAKGLGLLTMRERVELIGGTLRIHTDTASGTTIEATVPIVEGPSDPNAT